MLNFQLVVYIEHDEAFEVGHASYLLLLAHRESDLGDYETEVVYIHDDDLFILEQALCLQK